MTRSVCLKKLKALIAAAHDHVAKVQSEFCELHEALGGPWEECEKAMAALQVALHNELGVAPPGADTSWIEGEDIDPNGVPCECTECRPAKDEGDAQLSAEDQAALDALPKDLVARIVSGEDVRSRPCRLCMHFKTRESDGVCLFCKGAERGVAKDVSRG